MVSRAWPQGDEDGPPSHLSSLQPCAPRQTPSGAPHEAPSPASPLDRSTLLDHVALGRRAPSFARRARLDALCADVVAPWGGGLVVLATTRTDRPLADAVLVVLLLAFIARLGRSQAARASFCPVLGAAYPFAEALAAVVGVLALQLLTGRPELDPLSFAALGGAILVLAHPGTAVLRLLGVRLPPVRTAYIGPGPAAARLDRAVRRAASGRYEIVGHITSSPGAPPPAVPAWLGAPGRLHELILRHRVEMLVLGPHASRLEVFEELAASCLHLPVRLADSADFCEEAFGHVPMSEIDATWFHHLLHPQFAPSSRVAKRALDVVVGSLLAVASAPLVGALALLVRRDGGPAFF